MSAPKPNPFRDTPFPAAGGEYRVDDGELVADTPAAPPADPAPAAPPEPEDPAPPRPARTRSNHAAQE